MLSLKYLFFRLTTGHYRGFGIHSPFLYSFCQHVLWPKRSSPSLPQQVKGRERKYGKVWLSLLQEYSPAIFHNFSTSASHALFIQLAEDHGFSVKGIPSDDTPSHKFFPGPANLLLLTSAQELNIPAINLLEIKKNSTSTGIMFVTDIRASHKAKAQWDLLMKNNEIDICLDLFFYGICFCRRGLQQERFRMNF
jgi:hypothetical protein